MPEWAGPGHGAHRARWQASATLTLIDAFGIARSHPYLQPDGNGWPDNDRRFMAFSAALAALTEAGRARCAAPQRLAHVRGARPSRRAAADDADDSHARLPGPHQPRLAEDAAVSRRCLRAVGRLQPAARRHPAGRRRRRREPALRGRDHHAARAASASTGRCASGAIVSSASSTASTPTSGIRRPIVTCRSNYSAADVGPKATVARRTARPRSGLADGGGPLLTMVTRLAEQKGVDLRAAADAVSAASRGVADRARRRRAGAGRRARPRRRAPTRNTLPSSAATTRRSPTSCSPAPTSS